MDTEEKLELIKRNTEEIITEDDLRKVLKEKKKPIVYCGYEPSGPMHLGHFVTITKITKNRIRCEAIHCTKIQIRKLRLNIVVKFITD